MITWRVLNLVATMLDAKPLGPQSRTSDFTGSQNRLQGTDDIEHYRVAKVQCKANYISSVIESSILRMKLPGMRSPYQDAIQNLIATSEPKKGPM